MREALRKAFQRTERRQRKKPRWQQSLEDNTHLTYPKPWRPGFPYCTHCGHITACKGGICGACLDGRIVDFDTLVILTRKIIWERD